MNEYTTTILKTVTSLLWQKSGVHSYLQPIWSINIYLQAGYSSLKHCFHLWNKQQQHFTESYNGYFDFLFSISYHECRSWPLFSCSCFRNVLWSACMNEANRKRKKRKLNTITNMNADRAAPSFSRCIIVLISVQMHEAERSTHPVIKTGVRQHFCMVSDCIHHWQAGTEFGHASLEQIIAVMMHNITQQCEQTYRH